MASFFCPVLYAGGGGGPPTLFRTGFKNHWESHQALGTLLREEEPGGLGGRSAGPRPLAHGGEGGPVAAGGRRGDGEARARPRALDDHPYDGALLFVGLASAALHYSFVLASRFGLRFGWSTDAMRMRMRMDHERWMRMSDGVGKKISSRRRN